MATTSFELCSARIAAIVEQIGTAYVASAAGPDSPEVQELVKEALVHFAVMKNAQRDMNGSLKAFRVRVNEAKQQMDRAGLQLQNLNYEKTHIQNEIERCQNAQYLYEGIDLVDEDEFRRAAAPELLEYADEHQLMHNRLQHELAERKRLGEQLKELQAQKRLVIQQNKDLQDKIDEVPAKFTALRKEAYSLLQKLSVPDVTLNSVFDSQASLLPSPLYTLYTRLIGLQQSGLESIPTMIIRVVGDVNEARQIVGAVNDVQSLKAWGIQRTTTASLQQQLSSSASPAPAAQAATTDDAFQENAMDVDQVVSTAPNVVEQLHERFPLSLDVAFRDGLTEHPAVRFSYLPKLALVVVSQEPV